MESVAVKSRIAGQINRVAFEEGQSVIKGQLLFTIDRDVLERQAVEQQAELQRDAAMEQQHAEGANPAQAVQPGIPPLHALHASGGGLRNIEKTHRFRRFGGAGGAPGGL